MAPAAFTSFGEQLERHSLSSDKGPYDFHPSIGVYDSPFCNSAMTTSSVLDCLPSGILVEKEDSKIFGQIFMEQIIGDINSDWE